MVHTNHPKPDKESERIRQTIPNRERTKRRYLKTIYMQFWCRNIIWVRGWVVAHWWVKTYARKLHTGNKVAFHLFASQENWVEIKCWRTFVNQYGNTRVNNLMEEQQQHHYKPTTIKTKFQKSSKRRRVKRKTYKNRKQSFCSAIKCKQSNYSHKNATQRMDALIGLVAGVGSIGMDSSLAQTHILSTAF